VTGECFRRKAPFLLLGHPCENIPIFFHLGQTFKDYIKNSICFVSATKRPYKNGNPLLKPVIY